MKFIGQSFWANPARAVLCIVPAFGVASAMVHKSAPFLFEGLLLTALLVFALTRRPIRDAIQSWPRQVQVFGTVLIVALLCGQLTGSAMVGFPFKQWAMYSTGQTLETVKYVEYYGERADGTEVRFVADSGGIPWIRLRIFRLAQDMNDPALSEQRRAVARRQFEGYGPLLIEVHNRQNPGNPIHGFKVYSNEWSFQEQTTVRRMLIARWPEQGRTE